MTSQIDITELEAKARAAQEAGRLEFKIPPNAPQAWIDYFDVFSTATILSLIAELEQARKDAEALGEALTALEILYGCSEDMQTVSDKILEKGSRDMREEPIVRQQAAAFLNARRVLRNFGKIDAALAASQKGDGK